MEKRALGKNGPLVSALGLGCMGMSDFYGPRDEAESLATLNHALDRGVDFLDTADMYGFGENEELLAKLLRTRRRDVFLATKFGFIRDRADPGKRAVSGRADYVKAFWNIANWADAQERFAAAREKTTGLLVLS